jgi:hypothetical protein
LAFSLWPLAFSLWPLAFSPWPLASYTSPTANSQQPTANHQTNRFLYNKKNAFLKKIILRSSAQGMTMRQAGRACEFQNNSKSGEGIPKKSGMFGFRRKPPLRLDFCCFERARRSFAWSKGFIHIIIDFKGVHETASLSWSFCLSKGQEKIILI